MFDFIDEEMFADVVHNNFSVLDRQYVEDQCKDLAHAIDVILDALFDIRFSLIDRESGQCPYPFTLPSREHAEAVLACQKDKDKLEIAMVLVER